MTGEKILNYRIENLSEENQLYQSFVATHILFSKKVVVKNLKPLRSFLEKVNFNEEIKKLSLIQHPNVITLYDQLETASESYLIFEFLDGKSIRDHIRQVSGPIPEAKSLAYFQKVLDAFIQIHQKGITGGAINASNILITEDNNIKVLDLALSRFFQELLLKEADLEALSYTSPEVLLGATSDQRSDIYALGMLLYHMLTGVNPYDNLGAEEIKEKVKNEALPDPTQFYPVISKGMQAILKKAMAKDPQDRFPDGRSFRQALLELSPAQKKPTEAVVLLNKQTQPEAQTQTPRPSTPTEYKFVNLPLFLLIGLLSIMGIMLYVYS
ncbi:MAG: serine/threonine-protein kinase, partial [Bacteroidota bacterium]